MCGRDWTVTLMRMRMLWGKQGRLSVLRVPSFPRGVARQVVKDMLALEHWISVGTVKRHLLTVSQIGKSPPCNARTLL
jgi:hypothetical protein